MTEIQAWMVRAGDENELIGRFENQGLVCIGWDDVGDLAQVSDREALKQKFNHAYPDHQGSKLNVQVGQVFRFAKEIQNGDWILTYDKAKREILVGECSGPYRYLGASEQYYRHARPVKWRKRLSRDLFSQAAKNSLGSIMTVFSVTGHMSEIERLLAGAATTPQTEQAEIADEPPFYDNVKASADELIADTIVKLDPYEFQDLVAAVLRAMGLKAKSVPPGPDGGVDIVAHPDEFGFSDPRIKVQVKRTTSGSIAADTVRAFIGTLRPGEKGLFVTTSEFTKDAKRAASESQHAITLFDRDAFIEWMLKHFEKLVPEFQAKVPLKQLWVPVG